jgi:hypothetical protein
MNELTPDFEKTAIEDTQHWLLQAVVGLNLCPFAKSVVVKNLVRYRVTDSSDPQVVLQLLREELQYLAQVSDEQVDTTLLIAPNLYPEFMDFNQFLAECDEVLAETGLEGVLQVADFHPHYQFGGTLEEDVDNCTNRSPYPTLHLIRESSIDRAVAAYPDAAEIFERNIELLQKMGRQGWDQLNIQARLG